MYVAPVLFCLSNVEVDIRNCLLQWEPTALTYTQNEKKGGLREQRIEILQRDWRKSQHTLW